MSILLNYIGKSTNSFTFLLSKKKRRGIRINFQNLFILLCWDFTESKSNFIPVSFPFTHQKNKRRWLFFICLRTNLERPKNPESASEDQHTVTNCRKSVTAFFSSWFPESELLLILIHPFLNQQLQPLRCKCTKLA